MKQFRLLRAALALAPGFLTLPAHSAPPPQWKEAGVFAYNAVATPVPKVLNDFAQNFGASLALQSSVKGVANGKLQGANPEEFLDRMAMIHRFNWFFYNNRLHVSSASDRITERIQVGGNMSTADIKQALVGLGLFENKFGWGELQEEGTVCLLRRSPN
jgi:type III secretion protein C